MDIRKELKEAMKKKAPDEKWFLKHYPKSVAEDKKQQLERERLKRK